MRKRFAITLAANGRWPDATVSGPGFRFNWVKIDNRGAASVDVGFNAGPTAGDKIDTLMTVGNGKVRVFNISGPLRKPDGTQSEEEWVDQIYLVSAAGTTLILEVADHPIVDMVYAT